MAKCRSCGADMEWAEWANSGKAVPLDVGAVDNGNLALVNGKVHSYTAEDEKLGRERPSFSLRHVRRCPAVEEAVSVPGYWMHETSGVLRPVVERYIKREPMGADDFPVMRAYLRQWMSAPFRGPVVDALRDTIDWIVDLETLDAWIERAVDAGVDPL